MGQTRRGEQAVSSYSPLLSSRAQGSSLHRLLNSDRTVAPVARKLWLVFGFLAHTRSKAAELVSTDRDWTHIPWCRGTGAVVTASKQTQLLHFSQIFAKVQVHQMLHTPRDRQLVRHARTGTTVFATFAFTPDCLWTHSHCM